jgi:type II secretory pathway pseudopilin PulG
MSESVPSDTAVPAAERKRPFQYNLRHLLIAMIAVAVMGSLAHYIGVPGVIALGIFGIMAAGAAMAIRSGRFSLVELLVSIVVIGVLIALLLPAVESARPAARRSQCMNNLKQISYALHNYHDRYGCFPPAYVADKDGRPMHSWRVLILPFMEQKGLYDQYRFDEPWDGPNNRKLAATVIQAYRCPSDESGSPTDTNYVAVIGPETAWPGTRCIQMGDIGDGLSNTLLLAEVHKSGIHWMEPRDLHVLQMAPGINPKAGQGISSAHPGGAQVALADGSTWFLSESIAPATLRKLLTIRGGESLATTDW